MRGEEFPATRSKPRVIMGRLPLVAALAFAVLCSVCPPGPARAEHCSGALFDSVASKLKDVEAEQPTAAADFVRRSNELVALLADPTADLWQGTSDACPGDARQSELQTIARQRILVLWGKMIELGAVDGPIFPKPYSSQCTRYDGSSLQLDFIHAWVERLDDGGAGFSRATIRHAIEDDPLYAHVEALARERAQRLRITALPSPNTDDDGWLQANEKVRARFAAALPRDAHCGMLSGLWGLENRH
jgi:hypothetical protein